MLCLTTPKPCCVDTLRIAAKAKHISMNKYNKKFLSVLLLLLIISVSIIAWSIFVEPNMLIVRNYELKIPNWPSPLNGMKVAVIADLHVGSSFIDLEKVRQVVDMTNSQQPD